MDHPSGPTIGTGTRAGGTAKGGQKEEEGPQEAEAETPIRAESERYIVDVESTTASKEGEEEEEETIRAPTKTIAVARSTVATEHPPATAIAATAIAACRRRRFGRSLFSIHTLFLLSLLIPSLLLVLTSFHISLQLKEIA